MTIEDFIEFILDLTWDEAYLLIDGNNPKDYFLHGQCLELALVLKEYVSNSFIVINSENNHCAIQYQGRIYDASGDITKKFKGKIADEEDMSYMQERFGIPEKKYINGIRISEYLINQIKKCDILDKMPFYKPKDLSEDMDR